MRPVIRLEGLSKKYVISHQRKERYVALRDVLTEAAKRMASRAVRGTPKDAAHENTRREDVWALKDINLEVAQGERLGVVGRNGAGKSTLLKLVGRITEPTEGTISLRGRVASLLEVGTGFHPELTGRENIFLNGAVLGMSKAEIKRKFDEIVAFAEVERFLDTPVKRYSSGMSVRLAFAVAANLEPEILLVDEVLAVGDVGFQRKCLWKMDEVSAKEGRTILFVSHNMDAVRRLCHRAISLDGGRMIEDGPAARVVDNYVNRATSGERALDIQETIRRLPANPVFRYLDVSLKQDGVESRDFVASKSIELKISYEVSESRDKLFVVMHLLDSSGAILVESFHKGQDADTLVRKGSYVSWAAIPADSLTEGTYELRIRSGVFDESPFHQEPVSILFKVHSDGVSNMVYSFRPLGGKVVLPIEWRTERR